MEFAIALIAADGRPAQPHLAGLPPRSRRKCRAATTVRALFRPWRIFLSRGAQLPLRCLHRQEPAFPHGSDPERRHLIIDSAAFV
jgi:hypothetical protein